ncbi:DNA ligase 4-like [Ptychodera flava]|uniref:DNA ligase 4-like n=1 Tax=Ptychodera flava TaxID=63121 RepID=UPI00396A0BBF
MSSNSADDGVTTAADSVTVASKIPFFELCGFLDRVHKKHGTDLKKKLFREFLDKWRDAHNDLHKNSPNTTDSFYPAMRLLLPQLERERLAYGIKEHTLAKLYIEILGLGKDSPDARKLLNYKAPTAKQEAGDFASVAYFVLQNRCPDKGTLTIKDVNDCLDSIATNNAAKKKDEVKKSVLKLLRNTTAKEQKWLIRMIMKELKVGLSQSSILSTFHQDGEEFFNVTNNLAKVCSDLRDPKVRLNEIAISMFSPFSPMLGERADIDEVVKTMGHKSFYIETKLDGERMQLHKDGDNYKFFSRRSHEYTHIFGATPLDGSLMPHIGKAFKRDIKRCILDGEMVAYNPEAECFMTKGENLDIKALKEDETLQTCFCVFDCLLFNDKNLANYPLHERLQYLQRVFDPVPGRLYLVPRKDASTREDVIQALNDAIERREEGIVIKQPTAPYKPDKRKGSGWLKVKPEYVNDLMDELDLLIVGAYYGQGSRRQMVSQFLLALAVSPDEPGDKPSTFHSFCRVGSGYTLKELHDFNRKLSPFLKKFDERKPPRHIVLASGNKEKPDLWIEPSKSFVVQIKAAEITKSKQFKTGCTLRFPRLEKVRDDKEWHQCMTVEEMEKLRELGGGKLAKRQMDLDETSEPKKKKTRVMTRPQKVIGIASQFKAADVSNVKQVSKMFEGRELCVVNGPPGHSKSTLEKKIVEHGGEIVQNPGSETYCVLADRVAVRVQNIIRCNEYDVVKVTWLLDCLEKGRFLPWLPSHMIHLSPDTAEEFALEYDRHGDSYTEDVTIPKLTEIFQKVEEQDNIARMTSEDIAEIEYKYFPSESPLGIFRLCTVYMDSNEVVNQQETGIKDSPLDLVSLELRFYGAAIAAELHDGVTHVVCDSKDLSRIKDLNIINRGRLKKFHTVTEKWVYDCMEAGSVRRELPYEPKIV